MLRLGQKFLISLPTDFESQTTILLYQSGLSGEFLGWLLSECLTDFSVGENYWEDNGRYKYVDALGRTLMGGGPIVSQSKLNERIQNYQHNQTGDGTRHIVLAHPDPIYVDFLRVHLSNAPVVEIVSRNYSSQIFQFLARNSKITATDLADSIHNHNREPLSIKEHFSRYSAKKHLEIEWSDLILNNTKQSVKSIAEFLNSDINLSKFSAMLNDYKQRNRDLISRCIF